MKQCNICSSPREAKFLSKVSLVFSTEYDLVECPECGVISFDPLPSGGELARFYSGEYFNFSRWHDEAKGLMYARKLSGIKLKGKFLDVGSALGFFIYGIKQNSQWDVYGVEFGDAAVKYAKAELGLDVRRGEIQDAGFPDKFFDYVHVNNVLEHVRDPKTMLIECRRILRDDGYFFLSVPNGFNDSRNIIDFYNSEKLPSRSPNGHIFFFPKQTLLKLFSETGFEIISKKTGSLKRGLRNTGFLSKKKNWKNDYFPKNSPEVIKETQIVISDKKKYPDIYYKYRYLQSKLHDIPGLHNFGLDFLFLLRPSQ